MCLRRSATWASLLSLLVVSAFIVDAQAQIELADLRKIAQAVIKNGEIGFIRPKIEIRDGAVFYHLAKPRHVPIYDDQGQDPLYEPLKNQLIVELMRTHPIDASHATLWRPFLNQIDERIAEKMRVSVARLTEAQRNQQLFKIDQRIESIYKEAKAEYARRNGLSLGQSFDFAPYHDVQFTSDPAGARVWLVQAIEHRLAEAQGNRARWKLVTDPSRVQLEGTYYYLLQWGDRSVVGKNPIKIDHKGTYQLR